MIFEFLCRCFCCFRSKATNADAHPQPNPQADQLESTNNLMQKLRDRGLINDSNSSDDGVVEVHYIDETERKVSGESLHSVDINA